MVIHEEGMTPAQQSLAHEILEAITVAYPGYPWAVKVYGDSKGGGFFIRNLDFPSNWGMNCRDATIFYSASNIKRQAIYFAGEWLERANMVRGRNVHEDTPQFLEGAPLAAQPPQAKPALNMDVIIEAAERSLRDTPRPQVEKILQEADRDRFS